MIEHFSPISGVSANTQFIATAGYDNQVILWDALSKTSLARGLHDHLANSCAFSPCGKFLASTSSDYTARLWSVPEMKLLAVLKDHEDDVEMLAFHPTRHLIATASRDHQLRVFDFEGRLLKIFEGHRADVISVEWDREGKKLFSSSDDGTVKSWDFELGKMISEVDLQGVETDTLAISSDGSIYAGNDEGEIIQILVDSMKRLKAHEAGIKRLKYHSQKNVLVSLSYDRSLKIWSKNEGSLSLLTQTQMPAAIWPRSVAFCGEQELVLGTFGTSYAVFNYATGIWDLSKVKDTPGLNAVAVSEGGDVFSIGDSGVLRRNGQTQQALGSLCNFLKPFGNVLLTGGQQGKIFDALTGSLIYQHRSPLNCADTFVKEGKKMAVIGSYTGEAIVLEETGTGEVVFHSLIPMFENAIKGIACSQSLLFAVCATGKTCTYSISEFKEVPVFQISHEKIANGCASIGDERFVSVSRDLKLRVWDTKTGKVRIYETLHQHSLKCVSVSLDRKTVAIASYTGSVSFFDLTKEVFFKNTRVTAAGVSSLCATEDGFLASSYDGEIYEVKNNE